MVGASWLLQRKVRIWGGYGPRDCRDVWMEEFFEDRRFPPEEPPTEGPVSPTLGPRGLGPGGDVSQLKESLSSTSISLFINRLNWQWGGVELNAAGPGLQKFGSLLCPELLRRRGEIGRVKDAWASLIGRGNVTRSSSCPRGVDGWGPVRSLT